MTLNVVGSILALYLSKKLQEGNNLKLYQLVNDYKRVQDLADDLDQQTLLDTLDAIQESIEDKAENTAKLIRSWEAEANAIKEEEKRLVDRRKVVENRISSLKLYLQIQMEIAGIDKVKRPTLTVSIRSNPPSVNVLDESVIPPNYMIPQPSKISKADIAKALKSGEFVPGVELVQTKGLSIK